jgi:NADH-quinone oxidoreductase subunit G
VLRVLGNLLNLSGFEYQSSEDVRDEVRKACGASVGVNGNAVSPLADIPVAAEGYKGSHQVVRGTATNGGAASSAAGSGTTGEGLLDLPMYQIDAVVRRAPSLQKTREGRTPAATY